MVQFPPKNATFLFSFHIGYYFLISKQIPIVVILGGLGQKKGGLHISYILSIMHIHKKTDIPPQEPFL
jgi:hypothetical protein